MDAQSSGQNAPEANEAAIITWLQQNALPVQWVEAGNGFSDLQPLKQLLKDVKVVGLGETTHGTREFFQLKHRLVEFLVTEMSFNAFALEASFSACQPINDYILYGKGDRTTVLTGQWYVVWDTEEMSDLLDWLRAYNQTVPDEKKVKFYGVDITRNDIGRQAVLDYLRKVAPDRVTATESLFEVLAREEAKWPLRIDEEAEKVLEQLLPQLQAFIDYLMANKDTLVDKASLAEFDQALRYAQVMKQWTITYSPGLLPPGLPSGLSRSTSMAENLMYLVDQAAPEAKFILWEHNSHIGVDNAENPNLGYRLREKYGNEYFAFGFEFYQGAFQTRTLLATKLLGDLKEVTLPPATVGSLPWYLARTNLGILMMNLRASISNPLVERWLDSPQIVHHVGWFYDEALQYYEECRCKQKYDGLIFVDTTTATRPTVNALKTVSHRDGL
jgi:erythromycin esterase